MTTQAGTSPASAPAVLTTLAQAPSAPRTLAASQLKATSVRLSWVVPADTGGLAVSAYHVERAFTSDNVFGTVFLGTDLTTTISFLRPDTSYTFRVSARNAESTFGNFSNTVTIKTTADPPSRPAQPVVVTAQTTDSSLQVQWAASTNAFPPITGYIVKYGTGSGDNVVPVAEVNTTAATTTVTLTALQFATTYTVNVFAVNKGGISAASLPASAATLGKVPSAMAQGQTTLVGATSLSVEWPALVGRAQTGGLSIRRYRLEYYEAAVGETGKVTVFSSFPSLRLSSVKAATTYTFIAFAGNDIGFSATGSPELNVSTLALGPTLSSFVASDSNANNGDVVYNTDDRLVLTFSSRTDRASQSTSISWTQVKALLAFTPPVKCGADGNGDCMTGEWGVTGDDRDMLTLSVVDASTPAGTSKPAINVLRATVKPRTLRNQGSTSAFSRDTTALLTGNFGTVSANQFRDSLQLTPSTTQTTKEDTPLTLAAGFVTFTSALQSSIQLRLTVSAFNGALTRGDTNAKKAAGEEHVFTGNLTTINAAVSQVSFVYLPDTNFNGGDAIEVTLVNDASSVVQARSTLLIDVTAENDAPRVTLATTEVSIAMDVDKEARLVGKVSVGDVDISSNLIGSDSDDFAVTLQADLNGLVNITGPIDSLVQLTPALGTPSRVWSMRGSLEQINSVLDDVTYVTVSASLQQRSRLTVSVDDQGNVGPAGGEGLGATKFITVRYQCSANTPAPQPKSAKFSNSLGFLLLDFDRAVYRIESASLSVSCSQIFSTAALALLGTSPQCVWSSSINSRLRVQLGRGATVAPGNSLALSGSSGIIRCSTSNVQASGSFTVLVPDESPTPAVSVLGPTKLGNCDDLRLSSLVTGLGGRAGTYFWTSQPDSAMIGAVSTSTTRLTVPAFRITAGTTYTVSLTVINFLGVSSTAATLQVTKSSRPLPQLRIVGPPVLTTQTTRSIFLQAAASLSPCETLAAKKLAFQWSVASATAPTLPTLDSNTVKRPFLSVPAGSLQAPHEYTFTVFVSMADDVSRNNTATVTVKSAFSPLRAVIAGGSERQVARSRTLSLDASGSVDPDNSAQPFAYEWKCATADGNDCLNTTSLAPVSLSKTATLSFPAKVLATNSYTFTVSVTKGDSRPASTASTVIVIVPGAPPLVTLRVLTPTVNADDVMKLGGSAATSVAGDTLTYQWSLESGFVLPSVLAGVSLTTPNLVLNTAQVSDAFSPGNAIEWRLTVTDSDGQTGSAVATVNVNLPPFGGEISVTPKDGVALKDKFVVTAPGWEDDAAGVLRYQFFFVDPQDATRVVPQSDFATEDTLTIVSLPEGASGAANFSLTLGVRVQDTSGAISELRTTTRVAPPQFGTTSSEKVTFVTDFVANSISTFSNEGNPQDLIQGLTSAAKTLEKLEGADAATVRASMVDSTAQLIGVVPATQVLETMSELIAAPEQVNEASTADALNVFESLAGGAGLDITRLLIENLASMFTALRNVLQSSGAAAATVSASGVDTQHVWLSDYQRQVHSYLASLGTSSPRTMSRRRLLAESADGKTVNRLYGVIDKQYGSLTNNTLSVVGEQYAFSESGLLAFIQRYAKAVTARTTVREINVADVNSTVRVELTSGIFDQFAGAAADNLVDVRVTYASPNPFTYGPFNVPTALSPVVTVSATNSKAQLSNAPLPGEGYVVTLPCDTSKCPPLADKSQLCDCRCMAWNTEYEVWTEQNVKTGTRTLTPGGLGDNDKYRNPVVCTVSGAYTHVTLFPDLVANVTFSGPTVVLKSGQQVTVQLLPTFESAADKVAAFRTEFIGDIAKSLNVPRWRVSIAINTTTGAERLGAGPDGSKTRVTFNLLPSRLSTDPSPLSLLSDFQLQFANPSSTLRSPTQTNRTSALDTSFQPQTKTVNFRQCGDASSNEFAEPGTCPKSTTAPIEPSSPSDGLPIVLFAAAGGAVVLGTLAVLWCNRRRKTRKQAMLDGDYDGDHGDDIESRHHDDFTSIRGEAADARGAKLTGSSSRMGGAGGAAGVAGGDGENDGEGFRLGRRTFSLDAIYQAEQRLVIQNRTYSFDDVTAGATEDDQNVVAIVPPVEEEKIDEAEESEEDPEQIRQEILRKKQVAGFLRRKMEERRRRSSMTAGDGETTTTAGMSSATSTEFTEVTPQTPRGTAAAAVAAAAAGGEEISEAERQRREVVARQKKMAMFVRRMSSRKGLMSPRGGAGPMSPRGTSAASGTSGPTSPRSGATSPRAGADAEAQRRAKMKAFVRRMSQKRLAQSGSTASLVSSSSSTSIKSEKQRQAATAAFVKKMQERRKSQKLQQQQQQEQQQQQKKDDEESKE
eukprot:TRINITY_DN67421_c5_g3_i1.p1 TRINITY_DN67421_c5_g3~~TRINITY_DN67421_c5_g3_i1.p1  ORF type:complete len:2347 (-),score=1274.99 TRINITY_DN67421_c5_g3_i1:2418-9392(-)